MARSPKDLDPAAPAHRRGDTFALEITELAAGGDGLGHAPDGRVVFVPLSAPGDRLRVEVLEAKSRFLRARVLEILAPGAARTRPRCPVFGECGGCAWQHVDYAAQLQAKRKILTDSLSRIGGLTLAESIPLTASPNPYQYRGRSRVFQQGKFVGFRKKRSHKLCRVDQCPILVPALDRELGKLATRCERGRGGKGSVEWELLAGDSRARSAVSGRGSGEAVEIAIGGDDLSISPGVFVQSNALLLETLVAAVHEAAGVGGFVWDLYAGAGALTLGLARRFAQVVALESNPRAAQDLRGNLGRAGLSNVQIFAMKLETALSERALPVERPDCVVLDPPRTGLPASGVEALGQLGAPRIVYLSCDPATLARDLAGLCATGYEFETAMGFDLFPQTPHVEALVTLGRS